MCTPPHTLTLVKALFQSRVMMHAVLTPFCPLHENVACAFTGIFTGIGACRTRMVHAIFREFLQNGCQAINKQLHNVGGFSVATPTNSYDP